MKRGVPSQKINDKWYGDGTETRTDEGKLHLASVMDAAHTRSSDSRRRSITTLAYGALAMAVAVRGGQVHCVIMHTDQGSEYTAGLFRAAWRQPDHDPDSPACQYQPVLGPVQVVPARA